jgi:hypothetical protein
MFEDQSSGAPASEAAVLRQRIEKLEARLQAQRADLDRVAEMWGLVAGMSQSVHRVEKHEEQLRELREESSHTAVSLRRIDDEQIGAFNQLLGRLSSMQTQIDEQNRRIRGVLLIALSTAAAVVVVIAILLVLYFLA